MFCPYQLSKDGIEVQFATNHLGKQLERISRLIKFLSQFSSGLDIDLFTGHFYLTNLLLNKMKQTAKSTGVQGRIVNLSSVAHVHTYSGGIKFDEINDKKRLLLSLNLSVSTSFIFYFTVVIR